MHIMPHGRHETLHILLPRPILRRILAQRRPAINTYLRIMSQLNPGAATNLVPGRGRGVRVVRPEEAVEGVCFHERGIVLPFNQLVRDYNATLLVFTQRLV